MAGLASVGLVRATASPTFFPALRASSRDKKIGFWPSFAALQPSVRGGPPPPDRPPSRPHGAAFDRSIRRNDMAQIGSFTRNEDGIYNGEIRTLTLRVKATIRPVEREHDKAPDHRVSAGGVEFGAGWTKAARETGAEYLSLKLDDPSFSAPIYATLTQGEGGEHKLIWSR
jgi:uncharacterized protein (DUF736 family)